MKRFLFSIIVLSFFNTCSKQNVLQKVLNSENQIIKAVVHSTEAYKVQIKLTTINRKYKQVSFNDYNFNVNDSLYTYPASTVKFPVALLALEKLQTLKQLNIETPYNVEGDTVNSTFKNDIQAIFAVSDNNAYNRLFEFLGQDYINKALVEKGFNTRISHRLSTTNAYSTTTKSLLFFSEDTLAINSSINNEIQPLKINTLKQGKGFYRNDSLVMKPFNFSEKNYLPVSTLHNMMKRLMFSEKFNKKQQFNLTKTHKDFVLNAMKTTPRQLGYNEDTYFDGYCKFFMYGDTKTQIPQYIEIYNKVGYAYGYLTDCAYIKDTKHNIEFILTATIFVNENKIFNDDTYEYDSIGIPFLAQLGAEIYSNLKDSN